MMEKTPQGIWFRLIVGALADLRMSGWAWVVGCSFSFMTIIAFHIRQILVGDAGEPLVDLVHNLILMIVFAGIAVAWHRHILLREEFSFRIKTGIHYLGKTLIVYLLAGMPIILALVLIAGSINHPIDQDESRNDIIVYLFGSDIASIVITFMVQYAIATICFCLPALAVGGDATVANAWRLGRPYRLQIAMAMFLVWIPGLVFTIFLDGLFRDAGLDMLAATLDVTAHLVGRKATVGVRNLRTVLPASCLRAINSDHAQSVIASFS